MSTWRVGRKLGRTLYCDEVFVGTIDTPEMAQAICDAMNERAMTTSDIRKLPADQQPPAYIARWEVLDVIDDPEQDVLDELAEIYDEVMPELVRVWRDRVQP